jgi:hypothetical protein
MLFVSFLWEGECTCMHDGRGEERETRTRLGWRRNRCRIAVLQPSSGRRYADLRDLVRSALREKEMC